MSTDQQMDFKTVIQNELVSRCRKNPRYSLRSFAKSIGVSPAALSAMLNGKRPITSRSIEKIGLALGMALEEINLIKQEQAGIKNKNRFAQLSLDQFALISDWYHDAILELIKVKGFKPETQWIAKKLGITPGEARAAVDRLVRLNLLSTQGDQWMDLSNGFSSSLHEGLTSDAAMRLQKQLTLKSHDSIGEVPLKLRDHTSIAMAIDPADLAKVKELIKRFRRDLSQYLERPKANKKEVYQLMIGFFPLTRQPEDKK